MTFAGPRSGCPSPTGRAWRALVVAVAMLPLLALVVAGPPVLGHGGADVAGAATPRPDRPVQPELLDPDPVKGWGVVGYREQTGIINKSQVWDFAQIGDRLFVAGSFTGVQQNYYGVQTPPAVVNQAFLAAFDVDTNEWIADFRPALNAPALALATTPDGKLMVGGAFSTVNGIGRSGIAKLDPSTGQLDGSFSTTTAQDGASFPNLVRELAIDGPWLYVAGDFNRVVTGAERNGVYSVARVRWDDGRFDHGWRPRVTGAGVNDVAPEPGRNRVHLAGNFTAVNALPSTAYQSVVSMVDGSTVTNVNAFQQDSAQFWEFGVAVNGDKIWTAGSQHHVQVLSGATRALLDWYRTGTNGTAFNADGLTLYSGGDMQVVEAIDGFVAAGCHCLKQNYGGINLNAIHYWSGGNRFSSHAFAIAYDATTRRPLDFFPRLVGNYYGTWAVGSDTNGCLYVGGDYRYATNGLVLGGFARFCEPVSAPTALAASQPAGGGVRLQWDRPATIGSGVSRYRVIRDGAFLAETTDTFLVDPSARAGVGYTYGVAAVTTEAKVGPAATLDVTTGGIGLALESPADGASVRAGSPVHVGGRATDLGGVSSLSAQVIDGAGRYLQPDGSFADQPASIAANVGGLGTTTATLSADVTGLPAAAYLVRLNATGAAGRTAQATRSVTVEQSPDIVIGAGKIGDGYNLTAGMSLDQARAFLLDPAEFGPGGVVDVASLRIVDAVPTITADYLAGIDILFTGWIQSAAWTDAELQLVGNWVVGGGVVISTNDDVTHDGLATYWGEPVLGQSANPWFPADAAHPLVAGPFGTWSSITTAGNFGYFSPAGSTVLARDASNRATVMERTIGAGHIFLVADEGVFRSNFVAGANRSFAGNLFALAIGQRAAGADLPPIFVDTPRTLDAVVGTAITPVVANAVDPEGAALTFSATNLAPGLGFDPATRTLTGTPTTAGTYATELRATDMAGNSTAWAVTVTVRPVVVDAQPPTVPANLTLTSNGVDAVTLNWAPSTDDVAVKGYLVHRDFQFLAFVPAGTTFTDRPVSRGATYRYQVRAQDTSNNTSAPSATAAITVGAAGDVTAPTTPPSASASTNGTDRVTLNWGPSTDDVAVTGYLVHRDFAFLAFVPAGTTYTDTTAVAGATYRYQVRAQDAAGNNSEPTAPLRITVAPGGVDTTPPSTPANLAASFVAGSGVRLNWSASGDDDRVGGYLVHRDFQFVAFVPAGTTYTDPAALPGGHTYEVRAQDPTGNNSPPASVSITVP